VAAIDAFNAAGIAIGSKVAAGVGVPLVGSKHIAKGTIEQRRVHMIVGCLKTTVFAPTAGR
jgi:hypothetical protein